MNGKTGLSDAYARYADIVTAQLNAITAGDLDEFEALSGQREQVARSIDSLTAAEPVLSREEALGSLPKLEVAMLADSKLRARIEVLHADGLAAAREFDGNQAALRSYSTPSEPGGTVDLSL